MTHASRVVNAPPQVSWSTPAPAPVPGPDPSGAGGSASADGGDGIDPGQLKIKERLSFSTWQVALVAVGTLVIGMLLGSCFPTGTSTPKTASGGGGSRPLPAESGAAGATGGPGASATTAPPAQTATTAAGSTASSVPTSTPASGPLQVLLGPKQSQGAWTSTPFTVASGSWNIGWAFRCTPAPASGAAFQVFVVPAGGSPGKTAAVSETGSLGSVSDDADEHRKPGADGPGAEHLSLGREGHRLRLIRPCCGLVGPCFRPSVDRIAAVGDQIGAEPGQLLIELREVVVVTLERS